MSVVLALIIVVAAFTVIATLIMVVLDKKKEIALLKAMGASDDAILRVFLYQGGIIGVVGTALGLVLGYACCKVSSPTASRSTRRSISSRACRCSCAQRVRRHGHRFDRDLPARDGISCVLRRELESRRRLARRVVRLIRSQNRHKHAVDCRRQLARSITIAAIVLRRSRVVAGRAASRTRLRGDESRMAGFSIDITNEGCKAVDPAKKLRYEVKRAPDSTPLTPGGEAPPPSKKRISGGPPRPSSPSVAPKVVIAKADQTVKMEAVSANIEPVVASTTAPIPISFRRSSCRASKSRRLTCRSRIASTDSRSRPARPKTTPPVRSRSSSRESRARFTRRPRASS